MAELIVDFAREPDGTFRGNARTAAATFCCLSSTVGISSRRLADESAATQYPCIGLHHDARHLQ